MHRSGFVNIMGLPNVGKSTLLNSLLGEKLSIITDKPQTTRHRIIAIDSGEDYQMVFSDTPGIILEPGYKMQQAMNRFAYSALEDADVLLYLLDASEDEQIPDYILEGFKSLECPVLLALNKCDLVDENRIAELKAKYSQQYKFHSILEISALTLSGLDDLQIKLLSLLPEGPPYYPKDQFTEKSERFFVSEIIRENILELYHQEIPYSCEVIVVSFKESESKKGPIIRISAEILVERKSQKNILIGKNGSAIKELGTRARKGIEEFLESPVFLELYVKVSEKWRDNEGFLKSYGYLQ